MVFKHKIDLIQRKFNKLITIAAALALIAQPLYGLITTRVAYAATSAICNTGCDSSAIDTILTNASNNDVLTLEGDITLTKEMKLTKTLTINGNGHSINAGFIKSTSNGNAAINLLAANGVVLNNLTVNNEGGMQLHGINSFKGSATLNSVTISNFSNYGLVVNGSNVAVNNISTSGNGWGGIDVDQSSTTNPAALTVNGTSNHSDIGNAPSYGTKHLFIDDVTKPVSIIDTTNQYNITSIGNARFYKLKPAQLTVNPCTDITTVHTANLSTWDLGESRSGGHNELQANGLRVRTDSNTSEDKAAGYKTTNFALADVGIPDISLAPGSTGVLPSLQLGIDKDNNGTWDGYLVYEPASYGVGQFWSTKNFGINNGGGYTSMGTLNEYLTSNPDARVTSIGYSLGSGVKGNAVITKLTAGCVEYTFGFSAPTLTATSPSVNSVVSTKVNGDKLKITGSFTDDVKPNYATFQLVHNGTSVAIGTLYGFGSVYNPAATYTDADGTYTYNLGVPTDLASGEYSLYYTGIDFDGGVTDRMERKFVIDNSAPTVPNNLSMKVTSSNANIPNNLITNKSDVTASWSNSGTENISYIYKAWYDNGSQYNSANPWQNPTPATSYSGVFNQDDGQAHFCVVAVDTAGNESACSATFNVKYDGTTPAISISSPTLNQTLNGYKIDISGSATDINFNYYYCYITNAGGSEVGTRDPLCQTAWVAGTPFQSAFTPTPTGQPSGTIGKITMPSNIPDGPYTIHVIAKDKAGNTTEATQSFTLDNSAPSVPTASFTSDNSGTVVGSGDYTNSEYFTFTLNSDSAIKYQLKYWNNISTSAYFGQSNAWSPTDINGYMATFGSYKDRFSQDQGKHFFQFSACDSFDNCSKYSPTYEVTYDREAPVVAINSLGDSSETTRIISGTSDSDQPVKVTVNDEPRGTAIPESDGTWSTQITGLTIGQAYNIVAFSTDLAGNNSTPVETSFSVTTPVIITNPTSTNQTSETPNILRATTTGASTALTPFFQNFASVVNDADGTVAGVATPDSSSDNGQVLGAEDSLAKNAAQADATKKGFEVFGFAWYWLVATLTALLAGWWFIAGYRRRKNDQQR